MKDAQNVDPRVGNHAIYDSIMIPKYDSQFVIGLRFVPFSDVGKFAKPFRAGVDFIDDSSRGIGILRRQKFVDMS